MPKPWELYAPQDVELKPWEQYALTPDPSAIATASPEGKPFTILPKSGAQIDAADAREIAPDIPSLQQVKEQHPYLYGIGTGVARMVPTSIDDVVRSLKLPMPSADAEKDLSDSEQLGAAWRGEQGPIEQAASITGSVLQAAPLLRLPFIGKAGIADEGLAESMQNLRDNELQQKLQPRAGATEPQPESLPSTPENVEQPQAPEPAPEAQSPVGANVKGFEQTYGAGEIPSGETISPEQAWDAAAERATTGKATPYDFVDRAKTGAITPEEMGDLIYEHQQLLNRAGAAEGTPAYGELAVRAKDFAENVVKPAQNAWHRAGQTMQIAVRPDYTSLTGLQNAAQRMGNELQASDLARARELARENKTASNGASSNGQKLLDAMDKEYSRGARRTPKTAEQLRNELAGTDPCVLI